MRFKTTMLAMTCLFVAVAVVFVNGQAALRSGTTPSSGRSFNSITKQELDLLLQDVAQANPMVLKRFADDPVARKQQIDNLKQLLAFASQAQKDGLADDPINRRELESIQTEVTAVNYDRETNKDLGPMPPFGFITDEQVAAFWGTPATAKAREEQFQGFLNAKIVLLKSGNPEMKDREVTVDEKAQAREFYAKMKIYEAEYEAKKATLPKIFRDKVDLQVKLQQAQFLARLYSEKIAAKIAPTEEEINKYISARPELDSAQKKAKAEKILTRVKAGEDFAALANEFSEDPGNKGANGKLLGGLYTDVPVGRMVPPFEKAALALKPGEVGPDLVESDFGYHIIKLEKKNGDLNDPKSQVYDVRHILISTTHNDPADAAAGSRPLREYVRSRIKAEKETDLINDLVVANKVQVPDDFTVPSITSAGPEHTTKPAVRKRPFKKRS